MGQSLGTPSPEDRKVTGAQYFAQWSLSDVRAALERCRNIRNARRKHMEDIRRYQQQALSAHSKSKRRLSKQQSVQAIISQDRAMAAASERQVAEELRNEASSARAASSARKPLSRSRRKGAGLSIAPIAEEAAVESTGGASDVPTRQASPVRQVNQALATKTQSRWQLLRQVVQEGDAVASENAEREEARSRRKALLRRTSTKMEHRAPRMARVALQLEARRLEEKRIAAEEKRLGELCSSFIYLSRYVVARRQRCLRVRRGGFHMDASP